MKPKSRTARSQAVPRLMSRSWNQVRTFTFQMPTYQAPVADGIVDKVYSYTYSIADFQQLVNQSNNFEFYRIERIHVEYRPITSQVIAFAAGSPANFTTPQVAYSFHPYSTVPTTFQEVAQRGNSLVTTAIRPWRTSFKPIPLVRGYDSLTADGFLNMGPQWITKDRQDVPHFGFLIAFEPSVEAVPSAIFGGRLAVYFTVSLKNPILN